MASDAARLDELEVALRIVQQMARGLKAAEDWDEPTGGRWLTWNDEDGCWLANRRTSYGSEGTPLAEKDPEAAALLDRLAGEP